MFYRVGEVNLNKSSVMIFSRNANIICIKQLIIHKISFLWGSTFLDIQLSIGNLRDSSSRTNSLLKVVREGEGFIARASLP